MKSDRVIENTEYDTKIPLVQSNQKGTALSNDYGIFNETFDQNPTAFQETISDDYTEYGKDFLACVFLSLEFHPCCYKTSDCRNCCSYSFISVHRAACLCTEKAPLLPFYTFMS